MQKFDTDGDGVLSDTEKQAAEAAFKFSDQYKKMLEEFCSSGNGILDDHEKLGSGTIHGKKWPATLKPFAVSFKDAPEEMSLLSGPPQTNGYRSGFVVLAKGKDMHEHTTGRYEEALVVLSGTGEAHFQGFDSIRFQEGTMLYIPPNTVHSISNKGDGLLKYIYLVAPD